MHGMAGGKRIVGFARTRNAMAAAMDHAPIRPFLVDQPFQKMRQDGAHDRAEHQVIGLLTLALVACPRSQPKAG
jgi:hypothetical protein